MTSKLNQKTQIFLIVLLCLQNIICSTNSLKNLKNIKSETNGFEYTNWNDLNRGDILYLDRHEVGCENSQNYLQGFKLERNGDQIRYKYKCSSFKSDSGIHKYNVSIFFFKKF